VVLDGTLEGSLGPDRSYTAQSSARRWNFGVAKEDGQWRISTPPAGLMVADYYFERFYTSYNLYFIGNSTLVPDPIFLPNLPNQANVASVLMKALLNGPSRWLQPAVRSAIPRDTALSVDSVTVQDGIAQVPLSDAVLPLNDTERALLAAQVVYTLKQATGIDGVAFQVNQKPFLVPYSDDETSVVPMTSIPTDIAPVSLVAGDDLYTVRGRTVASVDVGSGSPEPRPLPGPLGAGKLTVDSLAVSGGNTDIAVVTDNRSVLRAGSVATGNVAQKLSAVSNLLRPQYSRYGELWAIGDSGGRQRMWVLNGAKMNRGQRTGAQQRKDHRLPTFSRRHPDSADQHRFPGQRAGDRQDHPGQQGHRRRLAASRHVSAHHWRSHSDARRQLGQRQQPAGARGGAAGGGHEHLPAQPGCLDRRGADRVQRLGRRGAEQPAGN
jgi:hypothetical protein